MSQEHKDKIGASLKGLKRAPFSDQARKNMSDAHQGYVPAHIDKLAGWNKGKPATWATGDKHWNWKGGISDTQEKIRKSIEYKQWRQSVFERDKYTCRLCKKVGGTMHADHIKPFAYYPELRFDIDNGRTLCVPCHRKTPTYGYKAGIR